MRYSFGIKAMGKPHSHKAIPVFCLRYCSCNNYGTTSIVFEQPHAVYKTFKLNKAKQLQWHMYYDIWFDLMCNCRHPPPPEKTVRYKWYLYGFSVMYTSCMYSLYTQALGNDLQVTKSGVEEFLPAATVMVVSVTASTTQGLVVHIPYTKVYTLYMWIHYKVVY